MTLAVTALRPGKQTRLLQNPAATRATALRGFALMTLALLAPTLCLTDPVLAQSLMSLPGQASVEANGSATYSTPIAVPPGTAGMAPSLSLDYTSDRGDGTVGLGWSLGALPVISRCPRTIAQDSTHGKINYDSNDRFCLGGQRLIAISGTYGANNTEYRTELESFSKVVSYGTAGTGPAWFKVWTKNGRILEFGNTADSRIEAQGQSTARMWAANKISDRKGNYLAATYVDDATNGQFYITRIDYTGNTSAGLSPYNSVEFIYNTNRPDQIPLYVSGSLIKTTVLLTNVKTYAGLTLVSDYRLNYQLGSTTTSSRLTSITLCDGGNNCLPATTFGWQGSRDQLSVSASAITQTAVSKSVPVDMNGDGLKDYARLGCLAGYDAVNVGTQTNSFTPYPMTGGPGAPACFENEKTLFGDIDGDGFTDALRKEGTTAAPIWVSYRNDHAGNLVRLGSGQSFGSITIFPGDYNGDGKLDILRPGNAIFYGNGNGTFTNGGGPAPGTNFPIITADFDGDGCTDIFQFVPSQSKLYLLCPVVTITSGLPSCTIEEDCELQVGDFNGDKKSDLLVYNGTFTSPIWLSTGTGMVQAGTSPDYDWLLGDWNGDGRTDLAKYTAPNLVAGGPATIDVKLSTGTGFAQALTIQTVCCFTYEYGFADWSNDGADDIWLAPSSSFPPVGYTANRYLFNYVPELLTTVTDGLGHVTTFTYDRLNHATIYTKDSTATYPTLDVVNSDYVVSRMDSGNGMTGTFATTYSYVGAKRDLQGRETLGFRKQIVTDLQTNLVRTTTFRQDFPHIGSVSEQLIKLGTSTLSSISNTFGATNLGGTRNFVFLSQSVNAKTDLDGTAWPTVTMWFQYDTYGNRTQVTKTLNPDGSSTVTASTFTNDVSNWLLGQRTGSSLTSTAP